MNNVRAGMERAAGICDTVARRWESGPTVVAAEALASQIRVAICGLPTDDPLAKLLGVCEEALDYFERHSDVIDGDGGFRPNAAMILAGELKEAMEGMK